MKIVQTQIRNGFHLIVHFWRLNLEMIKKKLLGEFSSPEALPLYRNGFLTKFLGTPL
jgi:hypothetical protein